ncbi:glycoside hydrolase family 16 protein [Phlebiopsis gigantea 11061_1 CR5-6]|uniref:Glycoside hydrolase family 16 protein n=1 Tax=Phlebiopsis gigantea (strain 11061_1 CR5-6) TaxID=745531 RepID=A0A0C3S7N6_PHLG1|nr:glycoside hydrolase family 16 protein [Phlebiopsis gigantea 11061_1 CR5-6]
MKAATLASVVSLASAAIAAQLNLIKEYAGSSFFDDWDFYGHWDDLNNGNIIYVNQSDSASLAYVTPSGNAVIKIDNTTTVPNNDPRNSVRITTKDFFEIGTIWIMDVVHAPYGCSVWPSIWTKGTLWPEEGEIDIIEGVNLMTYNQMALHTGVDCTMPLDNTDQTGTALLSNCNTTSGCTVKENTPNNYGAAFAQNGGGVWALQFDVSGIFIWFWQRGNVPASVTAAITSLDADTSSWGKPSASWASSSSCNIAQHFQAQQMVMDITACGDWAGVPSIYGSTCGNTTTNACYLNNVVGNGANYDTAYFEVASIRAFSANAATSNATSSGSAGPAATSSGASSGASTATSTVTTTPAAGTGSTGASGGTGSGAAALVTPVSLGVAVGLVSLLSLLML